MSRRRTHVNVPLVLQMEAAECGAACLGMVLGYYGRWVPLERLRQDCGVSRDGSKALYMMKAAESHGLKSGIKRVTAAYLRDEAAYPCILHWKRSHFVVLAGFAHGKALVADPAHGVSRIPMDVFEANYSGVMLTFTQTEGFEKIAKPPVVLRTMRDRLGKAGAAIAFLAISALILALHAIIMPVFSRLFVDQVLSQKSYNLLSLIAGGMGLMVVVRLVVEYVRGLQQLHMESYFAAQANISFLWHVLRLPIRFFQYRHIGDIATRQGENESIAYSFIQQFVPLALNAVMIVIYLIVLFYYQSLLALVGLVSVLLNILAIEVAMQRSLGLMRAQEHDHSHAVGQTYTCVEQIETIKSSGAETGFFKRLAGYQALANEKAQQQARLLQFLYASADMIGAVSNAVILVLGAYLIMQERFTPGMLMAFQGILGIIASPMQQLSTMGQSLQRMRVSIERVDDVFQVEPDVAETAFAGTDGGRLTGEIELRGVSFGFNKFEAPLLSGINLRIRPGESVAIVGRSGSGKSTFASLITGLYAPWEGEILLDETPLGQVSAACLRSSMTVVSQENHLFSATVEDNLRMWDQSIPFADVMRAVGDAQVQELLQRRKDGYGERVRDGGVQFSGGQRQQLEIARVLASNPSILILDEATSALDAETEAAVLKALRARRITLMMIAHRLSTVRSCDQIIAIEGGTIAEAGTHDELMRKNGVYARLIHSS